MTKATKELGYWLVDEFFDENIDKAVRILRVINKNGYDINYDELERAEYYKIMKWDYSITSLLKRRK